VQANKRKRRCHRDYKKIPRRREAKTQYHDKGVFTASSSTVARIQGSEESIEKTDGPNAKKKQNQKKASARPHSEKNRNEEGKKEIKRMKVSDLCGYPGKPLSTAKKRVAGKRT